LLSCDEVHTRPVYLARAGRRTQGPSNVNTAAAAVARLIITAIKYQTRLYETHSSLTSQAIVPSVPCYQPCAVQPMTSYTVRWWQETDPRKTKKRPTKNRIYENDWPIDFRMGEKGNCQFHHWTLVGFLFMFFVHSSVKNWNSRTGLCKCLPCKLLQLLDQYRILSKEIGFNGCTSSGIRFGHFSPVFGIYRTQRGVVCCPVSHVMGF
jgi:hypothetical protein